MAQSVLLFTAFDPDRRKKKKSFYTKTVLNKKQQKFCELNYYANKKVFQINVGKFCFAQPTVLSAESFI